MNTNMAGFRHGFQNALQPCALDKVSLSTERVKLIGENNPVMHVEPKDTLTILVIFL